MNKLNEFRTEKGLSLRELEALSGISFSTLSALETGRRKMNANHARSLSVVFDTPPEEIIGDDNYEINPITSKTEWVGVRKEFITDNNRLREIRKARGLKETVFANMLGVPRSQIHHWESGKRPIPEHRFDILCEVLGVSEEILLGIDRGPIPDAPEQDDDVLTPDDYVKPTRERKQTLTNKNGYVFVYDPLNPMSAQSGYVPLHRLVMSLSIGRPLTSEEVVHHIDENPSNNKLSNLMLFANNAEHIRHHKEVRDKAAQQAALELAKSLLEQ